MRNYTTPFRSHRRISLLATLAAAMMAVTSLVSSAAGAIPVGAAATPVPATHVITLTVSSGGTTHLAAKGDIIRVDLVSKGIQWSPVTVTQSGTVVVPLPVTTPVGVSLYKVVGYGQATFTSLGTPKCTAALCPTYVILWQARIAVPVVDPPQPVA